MSNERETSRFESVEIEYIGAVPTADLVEFVDEVSTDFRDVYVHRRLANVGAGGPGLVEAGIFFTLGAASAAFLGELGKDVYRAAKDSLTRLYRRSRTRPVLGAHYRPLEIRVETQAGAQLRFLFDEGLDGPVFESALLAIPVVVTSLQVASGQVIQFEWDDATGQWERNIAIRFGSI